MLIEIDDLKKAQVFDNEVESDVSCIREALLVNDHGKNSIWMRVNSFWMRVKEHEYPSMNVAVNEDIATANYFDERGKTNEKWVSKSNIPGLGMEGPTILYYQSETEEQEMSNAVIITAESAREVALEFFRNPYQRPATIDWYEL